MKSKTSHRGPSSNHAVSPDHTAGARVRLQKFLASTGISSRRNCEELILEGRVTVDGKVCSELGITVDPQCQIVRLDGERVKTEAKRIYVLNKPPGYVCTYRWPGSMVDSRLTRSAKRCQTGCSVTSGSAGRPASAANCAKT